MKKVSKADPLRNALLMKIQSGLIMPGEFIPSEKQLCMIYHLTRPTVRKVLAELCGMGLPEKQPGVGAVVKAPQKNTFHYPYAAVRQNVLHITAADIFVFFCFYTGKITVTAVSYVTEQLFPQTECNPVV